MHEAELAVHEAGAVTGSGAARMARRRSESSLQNDARILDAATREIISVGVDGLAMSAVARAAGLTTGAVYGRYESCDELAAAVWTQRVRDRHFMLLDGAVRALVDGEDTGLDDLLEELRSPSDDTIVALELLTTARRIDELEEVVLADVRHWTIDWGAGPRARRRRRRAQVVFTLGTVWGVLLHTSPGALHLDWRDVFMSLAWSFRLPFDEPSSRFVPEDMQAVHAATGDPVQDSLIDAVAAIVSRVGLERATGSRIARKAGLTSGAIYGRYETKEALLEHALEVLLARRFSDDLANIDPVIAAADPGAATARLVGGYLTANRQVWRRFRVEAHLAARMKPAIASTLDRVQEEAKADYLTAIGAHTERERRELDLLARAAQLTPIGLAFADLVIAGVPEIDWRLVIGPLSAPAPPAAD